MHPDRSTKAAVKIKGKGEGEKVWGGGNRNYLSPLCYAISMLLSFYGLATPHFIYIFKKNI
jgi:hypothetical protein